MLEKRILAIATSTVIAIVLAASALQIAAVPVYAKQVICTQEQPNPFVIERDCVNKKTGQTFESFCDTSSNECGGAGPVDVGRDEAKEEFKSTKEECKDLDPSACTTTNNPGVLSDK